METELEQDQEATTALYLNESTPNITTTGIISHKDFLWSVCDQDMSFQVLLWWFYKFSHLNIKKENNK